MFCVAQKTAAQSEKNAFLKEEDQATDFANDEDLVEGLDVVSGACSRDEGVVQVDYHIEEAGKNAVHQALKNLGCIFQAKW